MDAQLTLTLNTLAYADQPVPNNNPRRRPIDWGRVVSVPVKNVKDDSYVLQPGESVTVFDGTRSTSLDDTTNLTLSLSPLGSRYRFTYASGTLPAFRLDRGLACSGHTLTIVANANLTLSVSSSTVGDFSAAVVGDTVFIPGSSTGDSPYPGSPLNEGYWVVLAKDGPGTVIQLARPAGTSWSGASEVVAISSNLQFQAFSASGVQVGDSVSISAGFAASVQGTYSVLAVNPKWFEVFSIVPLPISAVAAPGTAGIAFYTALKRFLQVEVDQESALQLNGDDSTANRVSPIAAGDSEQMGVFMKWGPSWSLTLVNLSQQALNAFVVSAE